MKKIAFVALLSACIATPALADNTGKFYGAVDLGKASYSNVDIPAVGGFPATKFPSPGMFRIAGGYHITPMISAEVGYSQFGDSTLDYQGLGALTLAMSSLHAAAVGNYPLTKEFELLGKLGFSSNSAKVTGTNLLNGATSTSSKTDLLIGVGAQYNINSQFSIRAQYESFGKFDSSTQPIKAAAFSIGGVYNF